MGTWQERFRPIGIVVGMWRNRESQLNSATYNTQVPGFKTKEMLSLKIRTELFLCLFIFKIFWIKFSMFVLLIFLPCIQLLFNYLKNRLIYISLTSYINFFLILWLYSSIRFCVTFYLNADMFCSVSKCNSHWNFFSLKGKNRSYYF